MPCSLTNALYTDTFSLDLVQTINEDRTMPDVRITLTTELRDALKREGNFCSIVRNMIAALFHVDFSAVAVKLEEYAPGCEEHRPHASITVTIRETDDLKAQQQTKTQVLADKLKMIVVRNTTTTVDWEVKAVLDLGLRTTASADG